jgi:hypothetical protein
LTRLATHLDEPLQKFLGLYSLGDKFQVQAAA